MYIILIAISLSMDAFSLALAYGTIGNNKDNFKLSIIVGLFHFIMPLLGMKIGNIFNFNSNLIVFFILLLIGIQMVYESFKKEDLKDLFRLKDMLLFALAVSLDSFSVGIGLNFITKNYIISSIEFSIFSFIFTYLGLLLGNKLNKIIGKVSTILGGIILIIIGITYLF